MEQKMESILGKMFDWDKSSYRFLRGEKDMSPYSVIKNSEEEVVLIHNVVGIEKKDLSLKLNSENGQSVLYISGQTKDEISGKSYEIDSKFGIQFGSKIKAVKSSMKNGLLYVTIQFEVAHVNQNIVIE